MKDVVRSAELLSGGFDRRKKRRLPRGLVIDFETENNVIKDDILKINYEEQSYSFQVKDIKTINDSLLLVHAIECGYWATKLDRKKDLDLRKLFGLDVSFVTDKDAIKAINEASLYT